MGFSRLLEKGSDDRLFHKKSRDQWVRKEKKLVPEGGKKKKIKKFEKVEFHLKVVVI